VHNKFDKTILKSHFPSLRAKVLKERDVTVSCAFPVNHSWQCHARAKRASCI